MKYQFRTAKELFALCEPPGSSVAEVTLRAEEESSELPRAEIESRMLEYYRRMKDSVQKGLAITERSLMPRFSSS